jgi:hypothetical protein
LNRLALAFRAFWKILTEPVFADRAAALFVEEPKGPDLRVLAILQRDGRLVDFLLEDIDSASNEAIGAGVREIHAGCRKVLQDYFKVEPVLGTPEGDPVQVPGDFDPAAIRLTGNVAGNPPFRGVLRHHGWKVASAQLPVLPGTKVDSNILAPAEVELT